MDRWFSKPVIDPGTAILIGGSTPGKQQRACTVAFSHGALLQDTPEAEAYLTQHAAAVRFAELNRLMIAARLFHRLRCEAVRVLEVNHNTVLAAHVDGQDGWLHRKGATPSDQGLVMLPGSRDDYSYLLEPVTDAGHISLHSLAHGADRKWQRTDCKGRLAKIATPAPLSRTSMEGRVICNDRALIYEEAPQAYKTSTACSTAWWAPDWYVSPPEAARC